MTRLIAANRKARLSMAAFIIITKQDVKTLARDYWRYVVMVASGLLRADGGHVGAEFGERSVG
jgi:hypothetical protein